MFQLSIGEWGIHRDQGKVSISNITAESVFYDTSSGDTIKISIERAREMITPLEKRIEYAGNKIPYDRKHYDIVSCNEKSEPISALSHEWSSRPYQTEALKAISAAFDKYNQVILALPTGSGKTFVAVKWICDHVISKGGKVIWVAHRAELLDQAYATFLKLLPSHLSAEITWWAGGKEKNPYGRVVLLSIMAARTFPSMTTDILVIDEAHHEPAQTYQALQEKINFGKNLGLTATPKRLDSKVLNYEAIAYQKTFMSLVHEKWLARPDPVLPQTGMTFVLDVRMDDFSEESLSSLDNDSRNDFIVQHWINNSERYGKTLIFALNRDHARRLTESFRQAAPRLTIDYIISGEGNQSDRNTKVSLFRSGRINILINCKIFTEGFDCPDIKTIFLARPTLSVSLYLQMIGRGTRVTPTKSSFYLVDFQDDLGKFQNQLIRPWILGDDVIENTVSRTDSIRSSDVTASMEQDLPKCLHEDMILSPVDLSLIAGYVLYKHESGREDGFLVHLEDEELFLESWSDLINKSDTFGSTDIGFEAITKYKQMAIKRLPLQGFISAAIALSDMNAEYVKLHSQEVISGIIDFIQDVHASNIEVNDIKSQLNHIYAIVKYTVDEIEEDMSWSLIYENEKKSFDSSVKALSDSKHLRGYQLKAKIAEIYTSNLIDTHILEFDWERFCFNMLKNDFSYVHYLK